jgi:hypothetical protein
MVEAQHVIDCYFHITIFHSEPPMTDSGALPLLRHAALLTSLHKKQILSLDEYMEDFKKIYKLLTKPGDTAERCEAQLNDLFTEAELVLGLKALMGL